MEEPATDQSEGISPLKDCPFTILKNVLNDADHFGSLEPSHEHIMDRGTPLNWLFGDLVIDRIFSVEIGEGLLVSPVKGFDPSDNEFTWCHSGMPFI